jgi:hypothetical protein
MGFLLPRTWLDSLQATKHTPDEARETKMCVLVSEAKMCIRSTGKTFLWYRVGWSWADPSNVYRKRIHMQYWNTMRNLNNTDDLWYNSFVSKSVRNIKPCPKMVQSHTTPIILGRNIEQTMSLHYDKRMWEMGSRDSGPVMRSPSRIRSRSRPKELPSHGLGPNQS